MKKTTLLVLSCIVALAVSISAFSAQLTVLLNSVTAAGLGQSMSFMQGTPYRTHVASLNGASPVSATVEIDGSNDNLNWAVISTISLTTASSVQAVTTQAPYLYERGNLLAISGVSPSVTLTVGN